MQFALKGGDRPSLKLSLRIRLVCGTPMQFALTVGDRPSLYKSACTGLV